MNKDILFLLFGIIIIFAMGALAILSHEDVHAQANKNMGINSTIGFDFTSFRAYTQADYNTWKNLNEEDKRTLKLENSINESVAYNTGIYFVGFMGLLVFGFFYLGNKLER